MFFVDSVSAGLWEQEGGRQNLAWQKKGEATQHPGVEVAAVTCS